MFVVMEWHDTQSFFGSAVTEIDGALRVKARP